MDEYKTISYDMEKAIFHIFPEFCKGCGLCKEKCPNQCLIWSPDLGVYGTPTVKPKDDDSCIACNICAMVCPDCSIKIDRKKHRKLSGE